MMHFKRCYIFSALILEKYERLKNAKPTPEVQFGNDFRKLQSWANVNMIENMKTMECVMQL